MNTLVVLQPEQYDGLMAKLEKLEAFMVGMSGGESGSKWVESESARQMIGVSSKTWQNWRDSRRIPFSQFGRKIWYKKSDLEAFLESNVIRRG